MALGELDGELDVDVEGVEEALVEGELDTDVEGEVEGELEVEADGDVEGDEDTAGDHSEITLFLLY